MPVQWGLGLSQDVGMNALAAFERGQAQKKQENEQKALAAYATDPNPNNLNALAQYRPEYVVQQKQANAAAEAEARKRMAEHAGQIAKLFDGVNDEATYQQRLAIAQRMGIDTNGAPPSYNPQWVQENGAILKFLAEKPEALSTFGKVAVDEGLQPGTPQYNERVHQLVAADALKTQSVQPGGGVAVIDTMNGGKANFSILPNPGGAATGQPAGGVQEGQTATNPSTGERIQFRNGQWVPMGGQPAGGGPFVQ